MDRALACPWALFAHVNMLPTWIETCFRKFWQNTLVRLPMVRLPSRHKFGSRFPAGTLSRSRQTSNLAHIDATA